MEHLISRIRVPFQKYLSISPHYSPLRSLHSPFVLKSLCASFFRSNHPRFHSKSSFNGVYARAGNMSSPAIGTGASLLPFHNDSYDGVIVEISNPIDRDSFSTSLAASLAHWKLQGKKGVWIKLPISMANLIEPAVQQGFWYHHAEPSYLMLITWIPQTSHTLPPNASHRVGIGAIVLNEKQELLVVQESTGHFKGSGVWKIPTGVVEEGEEISSAAIREVKEETGVDTEFIEVSAFRQTHKAFFNKSDLFFLCFLRPLSSLITFPPLEIEAAQWMPLQNFAAQPFVKKHELMQHTVRLCLAKLDNNYTGFNPLVLSSIFDATQSSYLYLNDVDLQNHESSTRGRSESLYKSV